MGGAFDDGTPNVLQITCKNDQILAIDKDVDNPAKKLDDMDSNKLIVGDGTWSLETALKDFKAEQPGEQPLDNCREEYQNKLI